MKLGRRCIQVQCDLLDPSSVGKLIPRLLLSLDPPVHLAPTDRHTGATTDDASSTNGAAKIGPHVLIEEPQRASGVPVIPNNDIHILVNSAAVLDLYPAEKYPMDSFTDILQINLTSPFQFCRDMGAYWLQEVLPTGVRVDDRSIINVTSILSSRGGKTLAAYTTSKGGLTGVTKTLSNEWAASGIRVNEIAPGSCETEMNWMVNDPPVAKKYVERIPARRWGTADDFKGVVVFLASEKASRYITGVTVAVDGGWLAT